MVHFTDVYMYYVLWLNVSKWKIKSQTKTPDEVKVLSIFSSSGIASTLKTLQNVSLNAKLLPPATTLLTACGYIMMTSSNRNIFRVTGPFCGEFTVHRRGQWRGALVFSLICAWINGWINNGEAGDLRLHLAHYDVTVMCLKVPNHYLNQQWIIVISMQMIASKAFSVGN